MANINKRGASEASSAETTQELDSNRQTHQLIDDLRQNWKLIHRLKNIDLNKADQHTRKALAELFLNKFSARLRTKAKLALQQDDVSTKILNQIIDRLLQGSSQTPDSAAIDNTQSELVPEDNITTDHSTESIPMPELANTTQQLSTSVRRPTWLQEILSSHSGATKAHNLGSLAGVELAKALAKMNILTPRQLLQSSSTATARAQLAKTLGISRIALWALLQHAELLEIGHGPNGELPIQIHLLDPLSGVGISNMAALATLIHWSNLERKQLLRKLRQRLGGWRFTLRGRRLPSIPDLEHWSQAAHRYLAVQPRMHDEITDDCEQLLDEEAIQERILGQYSITCLEQQRLEAQRRQEEDNKQEQDNERRINEAAIQRQRDAQNTGPNNPQLQRDQQSPEGLVCYWVVDSMATQANPHMTRHTHICVNPQNGAISVQGMRIEGAS